MHAFSPSFCIFACMHILFGCQMKREIVIVEKRENCKKGREEVNKRKVLIFVTYFVCKCTL